MAKRYLTEDQMTSIFYGLGRGISAFDMNNPTAGLGAAMSGTAEAEMGRREKETSRKFTSEQADKAAAQRKDELEKSREFAAEQAELEDERTTRRMKELDEWKRSQDKADAEAERKRLAGLDVLTLDRGLQRQDGFEEAVRKALRSHYGNPTPVGSSPPSTFPKSFTDQFLGNQLPGLSGIVGEDRSETAQRRRDIMSQMRR